jgi:hypothetical protein
VPQATAAHHAAPTPAYTVDGTPANDTTRGIIIQNGQKTLRK